jgi:hypothetical protein
VIGCCSDKCESYTYTPDDSDILQHVHRECVCGTEREREKDRKGDREKERKIEREVFTISFLTSPKSACDPFAIVNETVNASAPAGHSTNENVAPPQIAAGVGSGPRLGYQLLPI